MIAINKYPVFEADQVLSQNHLNSIVSYLESQDRATRKGLIGIGIVCGLEISFSNDGRSITIGNGVAVTSLGFQIDWKAKTFSNYKNVDKLSDNFLTTPVNNESYLNSIFRYNDYYKSDVFKNFDELIETENLENSLNFSASKMAATTIVDSGSPVQQSYPIKNTSFFNNKVVALVLEVSLIDQKKCSEISCDDKGKRLEFNIRPILISALKFNSIIYEKLVKPIPTYPIILKRFTLPSNFTYGSQIINGYADLIRETQKDSSIDASIKQLYYTYKDSYLADPISSFSTLNIVNYKIDAIVNLYTTDANKKLYIQYVWDWINDIVAAYNEIIDYIANKKPASCFNSSYENNFPFHVLLGKIETITNYDTEFDIENIEAIAAISIIPSQYNTVSDEAIYKTSWIKFGNNDTKNEKQVLKSLLERLVVIINYFSIPEYLKSEIKVTPSLLGEYFLSKKSIPYYYNAFKTLNTVWNPKKTLKNNNNTILGYNASKYSSLDTTVFPLNYDLESYNFYRIEGHIGKNYKDVLSELLKIKQTFQLSFNVIAINAINYQNKINIDLGNSISQLGELELNYDLIRRDWENTIGKIIEWLEKNQQLVQPYFDIKLPKNGASKYEEFLALLKSGRNAMKESFPEFLKIYNSFLVTYEAIELKANQFREKIFETLKSSTVNDVFAEDLIDHLDTIVMVCQKGAFRTLYQSAQEQWNTTIKSTTLKGFIEKHPGMEHKAGVTKGGTFVIVYQDKGILKDIRNNNMPEKQILSKASAVINNKTLSAVELNTSIEDYKRVIQNYASFYLPKDNYAHLVQFMDNQISLIAAEEYNDDILSSPAVIADFYLPYICCSEGSSINFILGTTTETPADFSNPDFNKTDFNAK